MAKTSGLVNGLPVHLAESFSEKKLLLTN